MAKVELKQPIVEEISANIKDAQSVVLVDYRGLTVEQDTNLRKQLREAGITYKVYKNTMMNFAFKGTDCESLAPYLQTRQRLQGFCASLQRMQISWRSRPVSLKVWPMMRQALLKSLRFLPGRNCFPDCSAVCSHLLQTSPAS